MAGGERRRVLAKSILEGCPRSHAEIMCKWQDVTPEEVSLVGKAVMRRLDSLPEQRFRRQVDESVNAERPPASATITHRDRPPPATGSSFVWRRLGLGRLLPGPALAALSFANPQTLLFVAAMLAGMAMFRIRNHRA